MTHNDIDDVILPLQTDRCSWPFFACTGPEDTHGEAEALGRQNVLVSPTENFTIHSLLESVILVWNLRKKALGLNAHAQVFARVFFSGQW